MALKTPVDPLLKILPNIVLPAKTSLVPYLSDAKQDKFLSITHKYYVNSCPGICT
jgi:hypothetical protein